MHLLFRAFNYLVIISVIISLFKVNKIDKKFLPFFFLIWLNLLNEILSDLIANYFKTNAPNSNIYVLVSEFFVLCQLQIWSRAKLKRIYSWSLIGILAFIWGYENILYSTLWKFNSYSTIFFYFVIVVFTAQVLSQNIFTRSKGIIGKTIFILCSAFLLKYAVSIVVEIFWLYGANLSDAFLKNIYWIVSYVNLLVNIIYAIAVIWVPKKREYTWLSR